MIFCTKTDRYSTLIPPTPSPAAAPRCASQWGLQLPFAPCQVWTIDMHEYANPRTPTLAYVVLHMHIAYVELAYTCGAYVYVCMWSWHMYVEHMSYSTYATCQPPVEPQPSAQP